MMVSKDIYSGSIRVFDEKDTCTVYWSHRFCFFGYMFNCWNKFLADVGLLNATWRNRTAECLLSQGFEVCAPHQWGSTLHEWKQKRVQKKCSKKLKKTMNRISYCCCCSCLSWHCTFIRTLVLMLVCRT